MNKREIKTKKQNYIHAYDGIRTVAMLGVLGFHLFPSIFPSGYFGVVTFFVMAGFLSMRNIAHLDEEGFFVRPIGAIAQKVVKLYPELILMLAAVFLIFFAYFSEYLPGMKANTVGAITATSNIAMIASGESYFDAVASINPFTHLWALSIELQFYALISFAAPLYRKTRKPLWICALTVATAASVAALFLAGNITHAYYGTETRLFSFTTGAILALFLHPKTAKTKETQASLPASRSASHAKNKKKNTSAADADSKPGHSGKHLVFKLLAYAVFALSFAAFFLPTAGETEWLILYTLLAVASLALSTDATTPFLGNAVFRYFASRSYSIYLWHFPIMKILERALRFSGIGTWAFVVLELAVIFVVSELSHRICTCIAKHKGNPRIAGISMTAIAAAILIILPFQPHGDGLKRHESLQLLKAQLNGEAALPNPSEQGETETESEAKAEEGAAPKDATNSSQSAAIVTAIREGEANSIAFIDPEIQTEMNAEFVMETWNTKNAERSPEPEKPEFYDEALAKRFEEFAKEYGIQGFRFEDYAKIRDLRVCIIGDSIAYMARPRLEELFPNMELSAEKSRSIYVALSTLQTMELRDDLDVLILALGTNGFNPPEEYDKIAAAVPGKPIVITSIVLPWPVTEKERNDAIFKYAAEHDQFFLMDWFKHGKNRPELFFEDAIHPHDDGLKVYSYLLAEAVHRAMEAKAK